MPPFEAVKKYGSKDKDRRQGLYYTMSLSQIAQGFFLRLVKQKYLLDIYRVK
jgi:hypothetical protein